MQVGTTRTAELRQKLAAEAKAADEERAAREQREADKLKDPSHPTNVHRRLWKELMRLLQQASNEQLGKKEDGLADVLPAHARNLRIAEIKMELGMCVISCEVFFCDIALRCARLNNLAQCVCLILCRYGFVMFCYVVQGGKGEGGQRCRGRRACRQ